VDNVITAVIVQIIAVIAIKSSNCFKIKTSSLELVFFIFFSHNLFQKIDCHFFVNNFINNIEVNLLFNPLIINEVFPNPSTGSEWVEILYIGENQPVANDYLNYTISDDKRVIYRFQGDELWFDNLLVIELAGLNNDKDSVILKNAQELIIDEMSYTSTKKDFSWLRIDPNQSLFILGEASPLEPNILPTPSVEPTDIPQPSIYPSPTSFVTNSLLSPAISPSPTPITNINKQNSIDTTNALSNNKQLLPQDLSQKYFANYQNYHNLQISYSKDRQFRQSRQVFLGQKILKKELIDAIIGSSLLVIAAILLSYEQRKKS